TLARANAALSVRRLDLAMEHADAALEMARDDSGRARATMMRFRVLDKRNEYAAAALEGERALQLAIRAGDDDVAAEAARLLVFTTSVGLGKPGAAHRWADRADAWLVRLGEPAHARVTLDVYRGVVLRDERKLKDAESLLRNALGRARALEPPRPDMVANILINLGSTLQRASKFEDAEAVVRETLQTITHGLGADHPIRLSALQQLSAVLLRSGRADEGIELSREVLAGYEGIYGSESPRAAAAHVNLGTTLFLNGDHAGGRRHNRIALAIYEASGDVKAQDVAVRNLSQIAIVSGDLDEARDLARRDVELCRQVDDAPNLVVAMVNLATVSGMREEHQLAYESATQAVALAADAFGPEDPARALSWLALGNTAHKVGDLEESRAAFESGVALLRATTGAADVSWGPLHAGLAEMHAQAGRHEDAIAALSEVDLSTMHRDEDRRDASLVLAESRLALGQRTQARQDARRALQYAEASGEPDGIVQAQALLDRLK
ncbi:MAG: tetratricopeptide repeat protein, partial [Myxococcota bacterium]